MNLGRFSSITSFITGSGAPKKGASRWIASSRLSVGRKQYPMAGDNKDFGSNKRLAGDALDPLEYRRWRL